MSLEVGRLGMPARLEGEPRIDVVVSPTPDDEAAGHDPQLAAALDILRRQTALAG
jgi:hypothetical protein